MWRGLTLYRTAGRLRRVVALEYRGARWTLWQSSCVSFGERGDERGDGCGKSCPHHVTKVGRSVFLLFQAASNVTMAGKLH